jgi:RNA polymerase sigma factor (TIGR02999 family)
MIERVERALPLGAPRSGAAVALHPALYRELERLARSIHTGVQRSEIDALDLVHEAYLRLVSGSRAGWNGRAHFFGAALRAMHEVLADRTRWHGRARHGGELREVRVDDVVLSVPPPSDDVVAVREALARLDSVDHRKADVVGLRFFAGLTERETACALRISVRTVERDWRSSRAFLLHCLDHGRPRARGPHGHGNVFGRSAPELS